MIQTREPYKLPNICIKINENIILRLPIFKRQFCLFRTLCKQLPFETCMSVRRLFEETPFPHCTFSVAFWSPSPFPSVRTFLRKMLKTKRTQQTFIVARTISEALLRETFLWGCVRVIFQANSPHFYWLSKSRGPQLLSRNAANSRFLSLRPISIKANYSDRWRKLRLSMRSSLFWAQLAFSCERPEVELG